MIVWVEAGESGGLMGSALRMGRYLSTIIGNEFPAAREGSFYDNGIRVY